MFVNLGFFYRFAKKPYFFDKLFVQERRFSGNVFNFGFSSFNKFFYVLLDVGLKQYVWYFFSTFAFIFPVLRCLNFFYFSKHLSFLLFNDYGCRRFLNGYYGGYFPISFFNKVFLSGGFYKFSYALKVYSFRYNWCKDRGYDLIFDVDIHLSAFFGN